MIGGQGRQSERDNVRASAIVIQRESKGESDITQQRDFRRHENKSCKRNQVGDCAG